jgi:nucleoside-diphosphate-sugar epimerase
MQLLLIGGTGFIGAHVARALIAQGHRVAVFHRGLWTAELPSSIVHILGDRHALAASSSAFTRLAPEIVIDMVAYTEQDGMELMGAFRGVARRLVIVSSMDVYFSYGRFRRLEPGDPDLQPAREDAPLRQTLFPYRALAKDKNDFAYSYEKILVERAVTGCPDLPATILRLPMVYGPGDPYHRLFEYLKRMNDRRSAILLSEARASWRWTRGFVENIAEAIALAATDDRALGQTYNLGENRALSEAEWVRKIGRAAGWIGKILAVNEEHLPPHLRSPYDWRHHCTGDTARIRQELGFAEPVSPDEALARTIAWERAHPPEQVDCKQFDYAAEDAAITQLEAG